MRVDSLYTRLPRHGLIATGRLQPCRAVRNSAQQLSQLVFPHNDSILVEGKDVSCERLIELLSPTTSDERLRKMQQVIQSRSYGVVPVVEGLYNMGNLAAVCRSADAMGFGALHCIMRPTDKYKKSQRTAAGADKWLDTRLWDSTSECLTALKGAGYQMVVTHLSDSSVTVQEVDWTRPTAFVLGNEGEGVSDTAVQLADHMAIIPMAGFVESFNISVAAALIMYEAQQQRIKKLGRAGDLTERQKQQLLASFLLRGVKNSQTIVSQLLERPPPPHQKKFFKDIQHTQHQVQQQGQQQQQQQLDMSHAAKTADTGVAAVTGDDVEEGHTERPASSTPPSSDPGSAAPAA